MYTRAIAFSLSLSFSQSFSEPVRRGVRSPFFFRERERAGSIGERAARGYKRGDIPRIVARDSGLSSGRETREYMREGEWVGERIRVGVLGGFFIVQSGMQRVTVVFGYRRRVCSVRVSLSWRGRELLFEIREDYDAGDGLRIGLFGRISG